MVGILALLAIQIGVIIFLRLITPKVPRPRAAPFEAPNAEDGAPIPKPFGICQLSGTLMLAKDKTIIDVDDGRQTLYLARIALGLGHGPFDVLYDLIFDELALSLQKPARNQSIGGQEPITTIPFPIELTGDAPVKFNVAAINMFGGAGAAEGGINGEVCLYRGTDNQPFDPLVQYAYEEFASKHPFLAYIRFGTAPNEPVTSLRGTNFYWIANNPTPKPVSVIVGAYPHGLVDKAAELGITTYTNPRIGLNANPVEMIYACFTDQVWGMAESPDIFNLPQIIAKAEQIRVEGRGLSTVFVNQSLDDFIDDVLLHIRGVLVENPITGLVELQLLRADYELNDLPQLTKKNTTNFHQREGHFLETLNQLEVKYRQFYSVIPGSVTDEEVTGNAHFFLNNFLIYQTSGRRLTGVTAERERAGITVPLVFDVDYRFHADDGWFGFMAGSALQEGDIIRISYTSAPVSAGFVDATVSAQNPANFQLTGRIRSETYDYTMFTTEWLAQETVDFLRLISSRKLAVFTWTMTREGSHLKAGDVVLANEPKFRLENFPIRITRVSYGTPERPALRFEGIEDVFGEQLGFLTPTTLQAIATPSVLLPITAAVSTSCLGGASRIGLFAQDPALTIELWRADDELGTGAVIIATLPGNTPFYDDPQTIGVEKFYRARLVGSGYVDGPFSLWVGCTASAEPPNDPAIPTLCWDLITSESSAVGTATLLVTDSASRVLSIKRKTQSGSNPETAYSIFYEEPYTENVSLIDGFTSTITFLITYLNMAGEEKTGEAIATFPATATIPPVIPVSDAPSGLIQVAFHATQTHGAAFRYPPAELIELEQYGRRRVDASGCARSRGIMQVKKPLPSSAVVKWQYVPATLANPVEEQWEDLAIFGGPTLAADVISNIPTATPWMTLALGARQDIIMRAVSVGGDGATEFDTLNMFVELQGKLASEGDTGSGGEGGGGGVVPDPCSESTDNFGGFEGQINFESDWTTLDKNQPPKLSVDSVQGSGVLGKYPPSPGTVGPPEQGETTTPGSDTNVTLKLSHHTLRGPPPDPFVTLPPINNSPSILAAIEDIDTRSQAL